MFLLVFDYTIIEFTLLVAERKGFEPLIPFWSIHTFQACSFDHSDISPFYRFKFGVKLQIIFVLKKYFRTKIKQFFYINFNYAI